MVFFSPLFRFSDLFALADELDDMSSRTTRSRLARRSPGASPRGRKSVQNNEPDSSSESEQVYALLCRWRITPNKMWGDQAKCVWTRRNHIFSFLCDVVFHSKSFILLKTPLKSEIPFQSYDLLKGCQDNRKHKHLFPLFDSISKSIFANSNSFCLIIPLMPLFAWSHHWCPCVKGACCKSFRKLILVKLADMVTFPTNIASKVKKLQTCILFASN